MLLLIILILDLLVIGAFWLLLIRFNRDFFILPFGVLHDCRICHSTFTTKESAFRHLKEHLKTGRRRFVKLAVSWIIGTYLLLTYLPTPY